MLNVPRFFWQGDTVSWSDTINEYPSTDGWVLTFQFSRSGDHQTLVAIGQDDGSYLSTLTTIKSSLFIDGQYRWQGYVELSFDRHTIDTGKVLCIKSLNDAVDTRTNAEKILEALEAVMIGKATQDQLRVSIGGKALDRMSWDELLGALKHFRAEVSREQAIAASQGKAPYPNISVGRF